VCGDSVARFNIDDILTELVPTSDILGRQVATPASLYVSMTSIALPLVYRAKANSLATSGTVAYRSLVYDARSRIKPKEERAGFSVTPLNPNV
jgi:hypothetical protein